MQTVWSVLTHDLEDVKRKTFHVNFSFDIITTQEAHKRQLIMRLVLKKDITKW